MNNRPRYAVPQHGDLKAGYLFELRDMLPGVLSFVYRDALVAPLPDDKTNWLQGQPTSKCVATEVCPRNAEHVIRSTLKDISIEFLTDPMNRLPVSPIIPTLEVPLFVTAKLAEQLNSSGLRGVRCKRAPATEARSGLPVDDPAIYYVDPGDELQLREPRISPASANRCPFCGESPLECRVCHRIPNGMRCSKCGERVIVAKSDLNGTDDPRIMIDNTAPHVVEGLSWDGRDYCHGIVTKRFVDVLFAMHAFPFAAVPVLIDVTKMTREQKSLLEQSAQLQSSQ